MRCELEALAGLGSGCFFQSSCRRPGPDFAGRHGLRHDGACADHGSASEANAFEHDTLCSQPDIFLQHDGGVIQRLLTHGLVGGGSVVAVHKGAATCDKTVVTDGDAACNIELGVSADENAVPDLDGGAGFPETVKFKIHVGLNDALLAESELVRPWHSGAGDPGARADPGATNAKQGFAQELAGAGQEIPASPGALDEFSRSHGMKQVSARRRRSQTVVHGGSSKASLKFPKRAASGSGMLQQPSVQQY